MSSLNGSDIQFILQLDDAGSGITYVGEAAPGTAGNQSFWRIKKIVETGNDITVTWADGDTDFDNVWNNRASLTYS